LSYLLKRQPRPGDVCKVQFMVGIDGWTVIREVYYTGLRYQSH
jgi:hypothetical protein